MTVNEIHFKVEQDDDSGELTGTLTVDLGTTKHVYTGPLEEHGVKLDATHYVDQGHPVYGAGYADPLITRQAGARFTIVLDFKKIDTPVNET